MRVILLVLVCQFSGLLGAEKRNHNHKPEWVDHCWDLSPNHLMDPFCAFLMDVSCGALPTVDHASHTTPENFKLGTMATYTCDANYAIDGNDTIVCKAVTDENGAKRAAWSATPTCTRVTCDAPPSIDNGHTLPFTDRFVGVAVQYECDDGYTFKTDFNSVTCQSDTTWTAKPVCEKVTCNTPPSIDNGHTLPFTDRFVGVAVQYECDDGYTFKTDFNSVTCQNDTTWTAKPVCEKVTCDAPPSIDNGHALPFTDRFVGVTVQYECDDGYTFQTNFNTVTCQSDTTWTAKPVCEKVTCDAPPSIDNGHTLPFTNQFVGVVVQYECDYGYTFQTNFNTVTCQSDTTWTAPPSCQEVKCGAAPSIDNGQALSYNDTSIGAMVQYVCVDHYVFTTNYNYVTCQNDTTWSAVPACHALCEAPPNITHGRYSPKIGPLTTGTEITYLCDKQYEIKGRPSIICGKTGVWSPVPTCDCIVRPLDVLFIVDASGSVSVDGFKLTLDFVNNIVDFYGNAQSQFALISFSDVVNLGFNLNTFGNDTDAIKDAVANMSYTLGTTETALALQYAREQSFTAANGMRNYATQIVILVTDGASNNRTSTIKAATELKNSSVTIYAVGVGVANLTELRAVASSASYVFQAKTYSNIAQYSGPLSSAICSGGCPAVPLVAHGSAVNPLDTAIGNIVHYVCDAGYRLESGDSATCLPSSEWSGAPSCLLIPTCGEIPEIQHGSHGSPNTYQVGGTVQYKCDIQAAYKLVGNETAVCEDIDSNGTNVWTPIPKCECQRNNDVVFIIDGSGSVGLFGFTDTLNFVNDMISRYSATTTRFGLLTFSSKPNLEFHLNEYINDIDSLKARVANTSYPTGNTYTADALQFARTDMFQEVNGMRPNATQIAIIVTDGQSVNTNETLREAALLRDLGVTVYSIGVGDSTDADELDGMASHGSFVFNVNDYANISQVSGPLAETTCIIDCGAPPSIANGRPLSTTDTRRGDTIRYECVEGYELGSIDSITCETFATWSVPLPTCSQISCSAPPTIEHGYALNENDTFLGARVNYTCDADYVFDANSYINCQVTGNWTLAPTCRIAQCGPIPVVLHSIVNSRSNQTLVGTRINYACKSKYRLVGMETVTCQMNEQWSAIPSCECNEEPRDIVFIADTSGSVGYQNFQTTLDFLQTMTDAYPKDITRFGMITFSSGPTVEFYLNSYINDADGLKTGIRNTTFSAGGTDTFEALELAGAELFNVSTGMRENVTHIAVVVTDGQSNNGNLTVHEAQNLKDEGVVIYSVGIGDFDDKELRAMASNSSYVFNVQSFSDLQSVAGPLTELMCFE